MIKVRRGAERGQTKLGWLDSRHSFSFNRYYDPQHMGFRTLRVINDDFIGAGGKFGMHPHENMEILTWVLKGSIAHEDATGAKGETRPGEIQRMSAGTGIMHSEANGSDSEDMRLLQIWIQPERVGIEPGYEQKQFPDAERRNRLRVVASPDARDGSASIRQDAVVMNGLLDAGTTVEYAPAAGRGVWVQVAEGSLVLNGHAMQDGDGAAIEEESKLEFRATQDAEVLVFDLA